jgi:hypothetical protein
MKELYFLIEERGYNIEYAIAIEHDVQLLEKRAEECMEDNNLVNGNGDHYCYRIEDYDSNIIRRFN